MRMLGHVIVKLPAHRDGGSWSGPGACVWIMDVCGLVSNNAARQQRSLSPPSVAGHPCCHISIVSRSSTLLETHSQRSRRRDMSRASPPLSKRAFTPPPHPFWIPPPRPPLISLVLARTASYPYSVTTRCCVTPGSPAASTCQSRASEPHLSFPLLLLLATCFVEPTV